MIGQVLDLVRGFVGPDRQRSTARSPRQDDLEVFTGGDGREEGGGNPPPDTDEGGVSGACRRRSSEHKTAC